MVKHTQAISLQPPTNCLSVFDHFVRLPPKGLNKKEHGHEMGCKSFPVCNYMFKVNIRNTRTRCEICSKLTIKTPEQRHWHRSGIFIVNFEHISHLFLVFIFNFEQVNAYVYYYDKLSDETGC